MLWISLILVASSLVCLNYAFCHVLGQKRDGIAKSWRNRLLMSQRPHQAAERKARSDNDLERKTIINRSHLKSGNRARLPSKSSKKALLWRLFNIEVPLTADPGKDDIGVHSILLQALCASLKVSSLPHCQVRVAKKSFDSRDKSSSEPNFVYTVDLKFSNSSAVPKSLAQKQGVAEILTPTGGEGSAADAYIGRNPARSPVFSALGGGNDLNPRVVIVGAGPAGLFAAMALAEAGWKPIIIERGKRVEERGKSIGALFNRKVLDPESNLCYGEGGAGTWSDGKLTTRIGKNSDDVQTVLKLLVRHGAPQKILVDGKPHLGTDRLVRILKDMRKYLEKKGTVFMFDKVVTDIDIAAAKDKSSDEKGIDKVVKGVVLQDNTHIPAERVILSVGHSARALYEMLNQRGVALEAKAIAAGFRIEHPQELINSIQLGEYGELCLRGKGKVPVADYRLAKEIQLSNDERRSCYSFCMCPGGQIVPTSVREDELCINGMSFSQRQSPFANSALVVNIEPQDMFTHMGREDPLVGVDWQKAIERKAAQMGGGKLVAPVQRATDFIDGRVSTGEIKSSYRMGVKSEACHDIYPDYVTETIRYALRSFDSMLPGFLSSDAILHGVETRTSSPVRIVRDRDSLSSVSVRHLYPAGEGAGYAGGIMSAAVDGMLIASSILSAEGEEVQWRQLLRDVEVPWTVSV